VQKFQLCLQAFCLILMLPLTWQVMLPLMWQVMLPLTWQVMLPLMWQVMLPLTWQVRQLLRLRLHMRQEGW
jgi:hypothetical protein